MPNLALREGRIPAMSQAAIDKVRGLDAIVSKMPQVSIPTAHQIHGGVYTRTITLPAGVLLTGALIKIATTLIVFGKIIVYIGEEATELAGCHVLAASANRKQAFLALEDTRMTMLFATSAKTVEEAENEFTGEAHLLFSRASGAINHTNITGE